MAKKDLQVLKGYCPVSKKYYLLTLEKMDGEYKVVDMTVKSSQEANSFTSTIYQEKFKTSDRMIPCDTCHTRVLSSCDCPSRKGKCKARFFFQCCYCKKFQILYDEVSHSMGEIKIGQGDVIDLSKLKSASGGVLKDVSFAGGWDCSTSGSSNDIDFSCLLLSSRSKEHEVVYFGSKESEDNSVYHHGDNLTGETGYVKGMYNDDEQIDVKLDKISKEYDSIYFFINIYHSSSKRQAFKDIKNLYIRMFDHSTKLLSYRISQDTGGNTALIAAKLTRKGSTWEFKALGEYIKANDISEIIEYIKRKQ